LALGSCSCRKSGTAQSPVNDQNESLVIRAKRDGSLVSSVDLESHQIIEGILSEIRDSHHQRRRNFLPFSERAKDWPLFWLVDPLDGTESYLKSRSGFAVNIALCDQTALFGRHCRSPCGTIYAGAKALSHRSLVPSNLSPLIAPQFSNNLPAPLSPGDQLERKHSLARFAAQG